MIPLNARQSLPTNAIWYALLRGLAPLLIVALAASVFGMTCHGPLCGRGGSGPWILYGLAVLMLAQRILNIWSTSYVLTDKSISIDSGILSRRSCAIRFDRVQDVITTRGPLQALLGLKAIAIWTASPDQRVGNRKGAADGYLILDADDVDWLRDYLSDPQTTLGSEPARGTTAQWSGSGRSAGVGLAATLVVGVVVALAGVGVWRIGGTVRNIPVVTTRATEPAASTEPTAPAHVTHAHVVRTPVASATSGSAASQYGIACALHGSGAAQGVMPCGTLDEAQRCSHQTDYPSQPQPQPTQLTVVNRSGENVNFYWLNPQGVPALYARLPPGGHVSQASHIGAHWLMTRQDGRCIGIFDAATTTIGIL
jgi:membrane protein YdbS with pleckstrin-like domain